MPPLETEFPAPGRTFAPAAVTVPCLTPGSPARDVINVEPRRASFGLGKSREMCLVFFFFVTSIIKGTKETDSR